MVSVSSHRLGVEFMEFIFVHFFWCIGRADQSKADHINRKLRGYLTVLEFTLKPGNRLLFWQQTLWLGPDSSKFPDGALQRVCILIDFQTYPMRTAWTALKKLVSQPFLESIRRSYTGWINTFWVPGPLATRQPRNARVHRVWPQVTCCYALYWWTGPFGKVNKPLISPLAGNNETLQTDFENLRIG